MENKEIVRKLFEISEKLATLQQVTENFENVVNDFKKTIAASESRKYDKNKFKITTIFAIIAFIISTVNLFLNVSENAQKKPPQNIQSGGP